VLQNNFGDNLSVGTGVSGFTFATKLASGSTYSVTILAQPVGHSCTVLNGSGTVAGANVTNVQMNCIPGTFTVSGTVSGLIAGRSLVLQNNLTDNRTVSANGAFTFNTRIASGTPYSVTVLTEPTGQTCTVSGGGNGGGGGTVTSGPITNVR
jgi:hypothetical protein